MKELGVKQESLFYWCQSAKVILNYLPDVEKATTYISAFTVAELGCLLPFFLEGYFYQQVPDLRGYWSINYIKYNRQKFTPYPHLYFTDENEANARAKMLIYLIENKLIKVPK